MKTIMLHYCKDCFKENREVHIIIDKVSSYSDHEVTAGGMDFSVDETAKEIEQLLKLSSHSWRAEK